MRDDWTPLDFIVGVVTGAIVMYLSMIIYA